jgi:predicted DNA-binding antitoxin AbrB/MazE fold protein
MTQHVNAIYDNGVLRPLAPLDLREQELVALVIEKLDNDAADGGNRSDERRQSFEIFDEAGLIGCVEDAPADLSTNPEHMKGFGSGDAF